VDGVGLSGAFVGAVRVIGVGGRVGGFVRGFCRGYAGYWGGWSCWWVCAGPVTMSRSARRFWFCPYGTTGFGFLDGRPVGTKGICWVDRDSVTGVFCGTMASEFGGWRVSLVDGGG
jgi:hypothetical protein